MDSKNFNLRPNAEILSQLFGRYRLFCGLISFIVGQATLKKPMGKFIKIEINSFRRDGALVFLP
ncbi:MAG: hypothetical protein ACYCZ2_15320 [Lutibacter sp.]